jgi:[ribosomal protein S5]-alanine N-acetyltransferase
MMTTPLDELLTPHLRLRTLSLGDIELILGGDRGALGARMGARMPDDWPGPDLAAGLPEIAARMAQNPADTAGWVWVVIEQGTTAMVGDIGFHSPVRRVASVEIGYVIFPAARGRGYATEAAAALIAWAFSRPGVERVTAQIAPDNTASLRVARKLGLRETAPEEPGYRCFERLKTDLSA